MVLLAVLRLDSGLSNVDSGSLLFNNDIICVFRNTNHGGTKINILILVNYQSEITTVRNEEERRVLYRTRVPGVQVLCRNTVKEPRKWNFRIIGTNLLWPQYFHEYQCLVVVEIGTPFSVWFGPFRSCPFRFGELCSKSNTGSN